MFFFLYSALAWEPRLVNGNSATWKSDSVSFFLNTDRMTELSEEEIEEAVRSAAEAWNSNSENASFSFEYQGVSKNTGADFSDGEHIVSFDNSWTQDPSLLAVTHVWTTSDGTIQHFDIEVNIDDINWTTSAEMGKHDLQNSMTHEFGHALGLEHSDDSEATMAANTAIGETQKRDLGADDILGLNSLYTASNQEENPSKPSGTEEGSNSSGGGVTNSTIEGPSSSGSGNGPVALEKAGCSSSGSLPLALFFWAAICVVSTRQLSLS